MEDSVLQYAILMRKVFISLVGSWEGVSWIPNGNNIYKILMNLQKQ